MVLVDFMLGASHYEYRTSDRSVKPRSCTCISKLHTEHVIEVNGSIIEKSRSVSLSLQKY